MAITFSEPHMTLDLIGLCPLLNYSLGDSDNTDCLASLTLEMPQASPTDKATGSLPHYFVHIVKAKFAHPIHLVTILTEHACHHNSFWGSRCDSNHVPTTCISLKPLHFHGDFSIHFRYMTQVFSGHTSSVTSDHLHYFKLFSTIFPTKSSNFSQSLTK